MHDSIQHYVCGKVWLNALEQNTLAVPVHGQSFGVTQEAEICF
jgi:hypothetical protein